MNGLEELKVAIDKFAEERDWTKFHTPANLAKSISIEAGELLECFQWNDDNFSVDFDCCPDTIPNCLLEFIAARLCCTTIIYLHVLPGNSFCLSQIFLSSILTKRQKP